MGRAPRAILALGLAMVPFVLYYSFTYVAWLAPVMGGLLVASHALVRRPAG